MSSRSRSWNSSSSSSGRRRGAFGGNCGYCNAICIYNSIEIIFFIGVIANMVVIIRVARDRRLRDSTFVAIAMLAFADFLFLSINLMASIENVSRAITCEDSLFRGLVYETFKSISWFASNSHVAFLAILRYIMISNPLRGHIIMSPKRVIMSSVLIWFIGIILMGTLQLITLLQIFEKRRSNEYVIYQWITVYLIPVVITIVLHLIKVFKLKNITKDSATEETRKSIQRMSKIVVVVIIFAALLPLPYLVLHILVVVGWDSFPKFHFYGPAEIIFLSNSFINPFLYSFLSKRFRNSLREMFCCKEANLSDDSNETGDTPLSIRRGITLSPLKKFSEGALSFTSTDSVNSK